MSDYETISLVVLIIGLVISAISLGITIGKKDKNNRHQFRSIFTSDDFVIMYLGVNTVYRQATFYLYNNLLKLNESII